MGKGLQDILKNSGEMKVSINGQVVIWVWDYTNNIPRNKSEMTELELKVNRKERAKYVLANNKNHKSAKK